MTTEERLEIRVWPLSPDITLLAVGILLMGVATGVAGRMAWGWYSYHPYDAGYLSAKIVALYGFVVAVIGLSGLVCAVFGLVRLLARKKGT